MSTAGTATAPFPQRRTLAVLSAIQVIGGLGNGAGLSVGALLVKDVSGSSGWAGTATVMLTLGAAATTVPLAALASRAGRRPALATGWLLGATGALVVVLGADLASLPLILLGLVAMGASTAANLQSRFAAADRADPRATGRAVATVTWATTVGAVVGPNLVGPGAVLARGVGVPELAGPVLLAVGGFALAGVLNLVLLRPDPLRPTATTIPVHGDEPTSSSAGGLTRLEGPALTAVVTTGSAHAVMVAVMSLTPVHMQDHGASLELVGLTISLHIAGMYALSPVFGWLADAWGPLRTIVLGQCVLLVAVAVAGTSGHSTVQITTGLVLLGVGWSISVISGATLLSRSLDPAVRPRLQGRNDLVMNLSGAAGGLLAGLVVAWQGFGALNAAAATLTLPVLALVLGGRRAARELAGQSLSRSSRRGPRRDGDPTR